MMDIKLLSIDLAKQTFQLQGMDATNRVCLKKRLSRSRLKQFVANLAPCEIAMESCGGAHYWARLCESYGHKVKMMAPQHVKPFVMTNKSDPNDTDGIAVAAQRPTMRFVPVKSIEQQDIQALHRIRARLMSQRNQVVCELRGLLMEYGIVFSRQVGHVRRMVPQILEDADNTLTPVGRRFINDLYEEFKHFDIKLGEYDKQLQLIYKQSEACQRIGEIEGIGYLTATAIVAAIGDGSAFKNGRELSAWLGIVPKHSASGERCQLLGISKRGDRYLRTLFIHGGRSVASRSDNKTDKRSQWINDVKARRGIHIASVAVANKNARIVWALLSGNEHYQVNT